MAVDEPMTESDAATAVGGGTLARVLNLVVVRGLVPLWILAGALLKLHAGSPANLPSVMVKGAGAAGLDLGMMLRFSIGCELAAVGLIWLVPRLARWIAGTVLGAFFVILIADLVMGASSCGCFGSVKVHPAVTLAIDGLLMLGTVLAARGAARGAKTVPVAQVGAALLWVVAAFAVALLTTMPGASTPAATAGQAAAATAAVQAPSYYLPDYSSWIGRPWSQLDIAGWVRGAPADLADGTQYLIFYRKDCPHCHELLATRFVGPLPFPTTVVAVPDKEGFPTAGVFPMPCTECRTAELPAGTDWFLQTPVVVRLEDGVVQCAAEVDPDAPACVE